MPSFPTKDAIDVIEAELGQPVQEMFADLNQDTRYPFVHSFGNKKQTSKTFVIA